LNDLCVAISEDNLVHGEDVVIDGELVHEPVEGLNSQEVYALTSSAARKKGKHRDKLKLQFHVFDFVPVNEFMSGLTTLRYKARRNIMDKVFNNIGADLKHVRPVTVFYMGKFDEDILMSSLRMVESWGGEGLMINLMEGTYECKRTKKLLKVKTFKDADVLITDVVEGTGKNLGKLGSIVVKYLYNGQEMYCDCGSGFNDIEREYFWEHPEELIGQVVELQYFEITQNAKTGEYGLRFPVWKGRIRKDKSPEDITDVATV
jgi:DNA ligase-1